MNAKEYRLRTMAEDATAAAAKAQRAADGREIARKTQSRYLTWMISVVQETQSKILARTEGNPPPGLFEFVASDVAKAFPLGSAAIRLVGFVGELCDDAVQATIDLWSAELIEQGTIGNNEASDRQVSFMERGKALRAAKNWVGKLHNFGIVGKIPAQRAANYKTSLGPMLFASDVLDSEFRPRLLATALGIEYSQSVPAVEAAEGVEPVDAVVGTDVTLEQAAVQFSIYVGQMSKEQRNRRITEGNNKLQVKADPAVVERILAGEQVFDTAPQN